MNLKGSSYNMFIESFTLKIISWERKYKKGLLVLIGGLFFFFFGLFVFIPQSKAVQIAITPLVFEFEGKPGGKVEGKVKIMNASQDTEVTIKMESEDMFPEGEEGRVRLQVPPEERASFSLSRWITFEPQSFTLAPREKREVKFVINVPEYAEPGGHYASVLAKTEKVKGPAGVGVGIIQRVASLILLTVPGKYKEELSVASFSTSKSYYEYGPINFLVRFENKGTIHQRPKAKIEIKNLFGKKVAEISIEPKVVLPGAIRRLETSFNKKWLFGGRYVATLTGTYGVKNNFEIPSQSIVFWAFPWKVGVGILILILLIVVFFIVTRKRWSAALKILFKGKLPEEMEKKEPQEKQERTKQEIETQQTQQAPESSNYKE